MADGPPSSVDVGAGYGGGSGSSSSWEQSSGGYYNYGGVDPSTFFAPTFTRTDEVMAYVRLSIGISSIVLGMYALNHFYRSRWVLDIRTRSAYLVMFGAGCVVLSMLAAVNGATKDLWGVGFGWFWTSLLLFFVLPALFGSYICRALRLAVVFHPRAKRALPWLVPERNYLVALFVISVAMLAIPIYDNYNLETWEAIPRQSGILVWVSVAFAVVLACIYPFIRKVDDLFNISTELIIVTAIIILLAFVQWAVKEWGGIYEDRYLGRNVFVFSSVALFGVSVVDPLRRLAFDPLAATKRNQADRVLLSRRGSRSTVRTASEISSGIGGDSEDEARLEEGTAPPPNHHSSKSDSDRAGVTSRDLAPTEGGEVGAGVGCRAEAISNTAAPAAPASTAALPVSNEIRNANGNGNSSGSRRSASRGGGSGGGGGGRFGGSGGRRGRGRGGRVGAMEVWDFERLARTPLLAAAFEDFSRKALCHESVLFLGEVSRYQNGDYATSTGASGSAAAYPSQFAMFSYITTTFIKAGSVEEVNISDMDKKRIIDLHHKGEKLFEEVGDEERRMVFGRAYFEVRQMLEANLLRRFLQTDRFKSVRMQRENVQAMMDSPQQAVEVV